MQLYINCGLNGKPLLKREKLAILISEGATVLESEPTIFCDNLVCVTDNGRFQAVIYIFSISEMNRILAFSITKTWLILPNAKERVS